MKLGPQNKDEAAVFALEELRADVQYEMLKRMKQLGITQAALAKRMGVSSAWVSQILDDDANLTLESISKVFLALGSRCHVSSFPTEDNYAEVLWDHLVLEQRWWGTISGSIEFGRQEAAEFIFLPPVRERVSFVHKKSNNQIHIDDCLEAA